MRQRFLMAAGVLAAAGALAFTPPAAHADDWSKTYATNGRADLHVLTDDGSVSITSADQNEIYAHVTTTRYKIGPDDVRIEESQSGNAITLRVRMPHFHWGFWNGGSVHVDLRVPRNLDLDVTTGDGNVVAQPVSGNIRISTGNGNIQASGLRGQVYLHSGDGRIDSSGMEGTLDVNTGDGHITISGRFDALQAQTGDGSIDASAASGSKISGDWVLHSGDGRITLHVPSDLNANLDAHTGDGSISWDLPITFTGTVNRSSVRGKIGQGGGLLRISSGDGSIHLEKI